MPNTLEYALMAANAYSQSAAVVSNRNTIPVPNGWVQIVAGENDETGFLARAYKNSSTGEVVIAYGGTTFEGGTFAQLRDWLYGNIPAAAGFKLASQITDAAKFYLDVAANPLSAGAAISFTGHSLGGGLASLMAVFFDQIASTFDSAPFKKSADSLWVVSELKARLVADGYSLPSSFANYRAFDPVSGAFIPSPTRQAREGNVTHAFLKGEALDYLRGTSGKILLTAVGLTNPVLFALTAGISNIAGTESFVDPKPTNGNGWGLPLFAGNPIDMHSMPMFTGFLESLQLVAASQAHPELLQKIFTSKLNSPRVDNIRRNIIDLFDQRQFLDEGAWDVVADDVQRLTGSLGTGKIAAALVNLDLGMNYGQGLDRASGASSPFEHMFRDLGGGLQFTLNPAHAAFTKDGMLELTRALQKQYPDLGRFFLSADRYSLEGSGAMTVSATVDRQKDLALGGADGDTITTGGGNDVLLGLAGADTLDGGDGNDILVGGTGDDTLNGGAGMDFYYRRAGDGNDTIIETREAGGLLGGRIIEESASGDTPVAGVFLQQGTTQVWNEAQGGATLTHGGDWTLSLADGSVLNLGADIQNGDLGIYMSNTPQAITTDRTILGDLTPVDFDPGTPGIQTRTDDLGNIIVDPAQPQPGRADTLFDSAGNDVIQAFDGPDFINAFRGGNDRLDGGAGRDIVMGRDGDDVVIGGADGDLLRGDAGRDKVFAGDEVSTETALAQLEGAPTGLQGDFMDGGTEDDLLVGGAGNDALNGGPGGDLIICGAGDDDVDSDLETSVATFDWSIVRSVIQSGNTTIYFRTYNNVGFVPHVTGGDDVVYGGAGADWLFTSDGNDWIDGGSGDDVVFGEAGSDEMFGGAGNDKLFGDSAAVPLDQQGDDFIDGGDGDDEMNGDGGNDTLFGGDGNDTMFGDSTLDAGTDYLDGGAGDDIILGVAGDDIILGGDGNDFLQGDSGTGINDGADFISGDAGSDTIFGEGGDDQLDGGDGDDLVFGNAGSDVIGGGAGNDTLVGDDGDGVSGDADVMDGGDGNDLMLGDGGDDVMNGGAGFDQLQGGAGNDQLDGGDDGDVLFGQAGDDTILGGAGDDQIIGGLGDDVLNGGDGNDVYFYFFGDGHDQITDTSGFDFLVFPDLNLVSLRLDVGSLKIVLPDGGTIDLGDFDPDNPFAGSIDAFQFADGSAFTRQQVIQALGFHIQGTPGDDALSGTALNDPIQAFGGNDVVFGRGGNDSIDLGAGDDYADGGDGNDTILGGDGNDLLTGGAGIDLVVGGAGDDRLGGGPGNDQPLDGGAGNDTYLFGTGDGQDSAIDTQGVNGVQLLGGLTSSQVTLQRSGSDLLILVNGTTDRFTARGWFGNPAAWNQLGLGDGTVFDRAAVDAHLVTNQAPVLAQDSVSVSEDGVLSATGNALANDFDPEGRALRVTNPGTYVSPYGNLALSSNGAFTYALNNSALTVQSLAQGQTATDPFSYTATDDDPAGAASASSQIVVTIAGRNDAPVAFGDSGFTQEDAILVATGNVLDNDRDVDAGTTLRVGNPGNYIGTYGSLSLSADGSYTYDLNNASLAVQSLPQFQFFHDRFSYSASDGLASGSSTLDIVVEGQNDAPVVAIPLVDQSAKPGGNFSYQIAQGSFTDVDQGTVLDYTASLSDGSVLPAWLAFDAATQTFSGRVPRDATGFIDIEVTAADGPLGGEVPGLTASDAFLLDFSGGGGGGGGGGGSQGNEGVGNGEDPPPPGHDQNFNDGPGTGPGHPGAKGGNGLGHVAPVARVLANVPQLHGVNSGAAVRALADHGTQGQHGNNGNGPAAAQSGGADSPAGANAGSQTVESQGSVPGNPDAPSQGQPGNSDDAIAARLARAPHYDFAALVDWLAQDTGQGDTLDAEEIRRRWARVASATFDLGDDSNAAARGAAVGWQRFADALAAAGASGGTAFTDASGLGLSAGLPRLQAFNGLNEGLERL